MTFNEVIKSYINRQMGVMGLISLPCIVGNNPRRPNI